MFYACCCCPITAKSGFCKVIPANPNILVTNDVSSEVCNSKSVEALALYKACSFVTT